MTEAVPCHSLTETCPQVAAVVASLASVTRTVSELAGLITVHSDLLRISQQYKTPADCGAATLSRCCGSSGGQRQMRISFSCTACRHQQSPLCQAGVRHEMYDSF